MKVDIKANPASVQIGVPNLGAVVTRGPAGATFTPGVSEEGIISWTNNGGLVNPDPVNIRGPQGEQGERGEQGPQGEIGETGPKGDTGLQGPKGDKGDKGDTGNTGPKGDTGPRGPEGLRGETGAKGATGDDGITPTATVTTITGGHNVAFSYGSGDPRNTDFNVMDGVDGSGVPAGGTTGQALVKSSNTDYAVTWGDVHQVPSGGTQGQVLQKSSSTDYAVAWADQSGGGMAVTITYSAHVYTADKTFDEIYETLVTNGQCVYVRSASGIFLPRSYSSDSIYFTHVAFQNTVGNKQARGEGYKISKLNGQTVVEWSNTYGGILEVPTVYETPWSIRIDRVNGAYRVGNDSNAPELYKCIPNPFGFAYLQSEYEGEHGTTETVGDTFPCVNVEVGEFWYDDWDQYVISATFYFEKVKNISGVDTLCQFSVHTDNSWQDGWLYTTVTYTETPIGGGGSGGGMLVTLTRSNGIEVVDKTFDEIYDALTVQKIPVMLVENIYANKIPYMPVEAMNTDYSQYIKFVRLSFTSSVFQQTYYNINKNSQGNTTVSKYIDYEYLPRIYENAWSITVEENNGVWSITEANTPGSYCCIQNPQGSIKINTTYHLAQLDDDYWATEAFPFVKATVSEHYDSDDYGSWVPDATIYFEKIKNISGVETRCQFAVYINCLWDDSVGGEYDTVTYTETAL